MLKHSLRTSVILLALAANNLTYSLVHYTKVHFNSLNNFTICTQLQENTILHKHFHRPFEKIISPANYDSSTEIRDREFLVEFFDSSVNRTLTKFELKNHCNQVLVSRPAQSHSSSNDIRRLNSNIVKILDGGDPLNRIDVVFMGDGYTEKERSKYFADIQRLVNETFHSPTFSEFLPILNIWAVFTPSEESGISYPGKPKSTYFKLYRNSNRTLRGIYVQNKNRARRICRQLGPSSCDFPVIIGNDPFYGGLGGEFAIATSSKTSGSIVLRHELGHNFANVGEEYDGGEVYSGANSAKSLRTLGWKSWLSGSLREEKLSARVLSFPNQDLDRKALTYSFNSDGKGSGWNLGVSLSGCKNDSDVRFELDGVELKWFSKGTHDKHFYSWTSTANGLSKGRHNLTIFAPMQNANMNPLPHELMIARSVGSVQLFEFGNEREFQRENDVISAYPTWNYAGVKSYRPTFNGCLMRNMTHNHLCSVCKESVWLRFLSRISLIDDLKINRKDNSSQVSLTLLGLGQFRKLGSPIKGEFLEIKWQMNGIEQTQFHNETTISAEKGVWKVTVKLITPRIRNDRRNVTGESRHFVIR